MRTKKWLLVFVLSLFSAVCLSFGQTTKSHYELASPKDKNEQIQNFEWHHNLLDLCVVDFETDEEFHSDSDTDYNSCYPFFSLKVPVVFFNFCNDYGQNSNELSYGRLFLFKKGCSQPIYLIHQVFLI